MNKHHLRGALAVASALALVACGSDGGSGGTDAAAGEAGAWQPNRPITYIIPYGTGGSTDPIGRQFASQLSEMLGVEVIVENREGGAATIGTTGIVTAQPDCYTLGLSNHQALANQAPLNFFIDLETTEIFIQAWKGRVRRAGRWPVKPSNSKKPWAVRLSLVTNSASLWI